MVLNSTPSQIGKPIESALDIPTSSQVGRLDRAVMLQHLCPVVLSASKPLEQWTLTSAGTLWTLPRWTIRPKSLKRNFQPFLCSQNWRMKFTRSPAACARGQAMTAKPGRAAWAPSVVQRLAQILLYGLGRRLAWLLCHDLIRDGELGAFVLHDERRRCRRNGRRKEQEGENRSHFYTGADEVDRMPTALSGHISSSTPRP